MVNPRVAWRNAGRVGVLFALTVPQVCLADYSNMVSFHGTLVIGVFLGLPTAILCVLVESISPRRLQPAWLTVAAALGTVITIPPALIASKESGVAGEWWYVFLWLGVPVLATLALRGMLRDSLARLAAGWLVALAVLAI